MSRKRPGSAGETTVATRLGARAGVYLLASAAMFAAAFAAAYGAGRSGFEAATFAFAVVGAFAGLSALLGLRARDRRDEQVARDLGELAESQRRTLADAVERKPELRVLFLNEDAGVQRARIVRRQPRPLDIEQTVAFERTLALRTLPSAKTRLAGSLEIYRKPTADDRDAFREKVAAYTKDLREALQQYDAHRKEHALLVRGRFRFENHGPRSAHNVRVKAYFPDPFEAVTQLDRPGLPARPTFHGKRAPLAALLGGDARRTGASEASILAPDTAAPSASSGVARPSYRSGSALVEVGVEKLQPSSSADMDEAGWVLRLPRPGEYRIRWEAACEELADPARGDLHLEVVDLHDDTPIHSIKELLADVEAQAHGDLLETSAF